MGAVPPAVGAGERGDTGSVSAGGSRASNCHLCTLGEVVAAHKERSSAATARRSTGCCSQASSSLTRVASRVLQQWVRHQVGKHMTGKLGWPACDAGPQSPRAHGAMA